MAWPTEAGALQRARLQSEGSRRRARSGGRVFPAGFFGAFSGGFDGLRIYGSGAASDGAAQASEGANLGNYRSSTEVASLGVFGAMERISIERVGEAHAPGVGALETDGSGQFRWTAPGSEIPGAYRYIGDGMTAVLADGETPGKGLRVRRSGTAPAAASRSIKMVEIYNGPVGMDNVSHSERNGGDNEYRAFFLKNMTPGKIDLRLYLNALGTARTVNVAGYAASGAITLPVAASTGDWPLSGFVENQDTGEVLYYSSRTLVSPYTLTVPTAGRDVYAELGGGAAGTSGDSLVPVPGLRIAKEDPSNALTGFIQTIANEGAAPSGVSWLHPSAEGDASVLEINDLAALNIVGLWIHRKVVAGAAARACIQNQIVIDHYAAA